MHEYALMEKVIATIQAELKKTAGCPAGAALEVHLRVGALAVHSAEATRQAYQVLTRGTALDGSRLELTIEPAVVSCPQCGFQGVLPAGAVDPHDASPLTQCPGCGALAPVTGSRGVESIEIRWD